MGAGIPSGGADALPEVSYVDVVTAEAFERSDAVGDTGRVVGGLTAVESVELAVEFVIVDACELDLKMLAANRGLLDELEEGVAVVPILHNSITTMFACIICIISCYDLSRILDIPSRQLGQRRKPSTAGRAWYLRRWFRIYSYIWRWLLRLFAAC